MGPAPANGAARDRELSTNGGADTGAGRPRSVQARIRACILRVVDEEPDYWRGWAQLAEALRTEMWRDRAIVFMFGVAGIALAVESLLRWGNT